MVWNFLAALFLIWYTRQYEEKIKPGAVFGGWLVLAGIGRVIIEFFRPDQPRIPGTNFSYSALVAALMAVAGVIFLLVRYGKLHLNLAEGWEEEYKISEPEKKIPTRKTVQASVETEEEEEMDVPKKRTVNKAKPKAKTKTVSSK